MNSFNDEFCEYTSTPVTENFFSCPGGSSLDNTCPSGCRNVGQGTCEKGRAKTNTTI